METQLAHAVILGAGVMAGMLVCQWTLVAGKSGYVLLGAAVRRIMYGKQEHPGRCDFCLGVCPCRKAKPVYPSGPPA